MHRKLLLEEFHMAQDHITSLFAKIRPRLISETSDEVFVVSYHSNEFLDLD